MKIRKLKIENSERGFSLFISIVVMGALLLVAFAVSNLASKEVSFATFNRDSQYAFFAADAGIECAIFWDSKASPSAFDPATPGSPISCNGVSMSTGKLISGTTTTMMIGGGGNSKSVFGFLLWGASDQPCVHVIVNKNPSGTTKINAYGYNNCNQSDPRRVERGVEVNY